MKAIVTIPSAVDSRKRSWAKALRNVDATKANGYAFEGDWVRRGERAELPAGSLVMLYDEPGSVKNWYPLVRVMRVEEDGTLHEVLSYEGEVGERSWALAIRDRVTELLAEPVAAPEKEEDTALIAAAQSMYDALWAIANMQVQEHTNRDEVLALCMSIARLELEKCRMMAQDDQGKN